MIKQESRVINQCPSEILSSGEAEVFELPRAHLHISAKTHQPRILLNWNFSIFQGFFELLHFFVRRNRRERSLCGPESVLILCVGLRDPVPEEAPVHLASAGCVFLDHLCDPGRQPGFPGRNSRMLERIRGCCDIDTEFA